MPPRLEGWGVPRAAIERAVEAAVIVASLTEDAVLAAALLAQAAFASAPAEAREIELHFGPRGQRAGARARALRRHPADADGRRRAPPRARAGRGAAQDAAVGGQRSAPGARAPRAPAGRSQRLQGWPRRHARAAGARDARGVRAARQSPGALAAQVGARGPGVPLPAARRLPAHRRGARREARRPRALHHRVVPHARRR